MLSRKMTNHDGSDEQDPDSSTQALHNLLADLNNNNLNVQPPTVQTSTTWSFSAANITGHPSPARTPDHAGLPVPLPHRTSSRSPARSNSDLDALSNPHTSLFNSSNRVSFLSGRPTSSVSANTAQASMTALPSSSSSRPLSALTGPSMTSSGGRRNVHYQPDNMTTPAKRSRLTRAEKEVDDPTAAVEQTSDRRMHATPTALSRLFSAPEVSSPLLSREPSYSRTASGNVYTRGQCSSGHRFGIITV